MLALHSLADILNTCEAQGSGGLREARHRFHSIVEVALPDIPVGSPDVPRVRHRVQIRGRTRIGMQTIQEPDQTVLSRTPHARTGAGVSGREMR